MSTDVSQTLFPHYLVSISYIYIPLGYNAIDLYEPFRDGCVFFSPFISFFFSVSPRV